MPRSRITTYFFALFVASGLMLVPFGVSACGYRAYTPPGKTVKVSELSQALIVWKNGTEHLIIDPGLTGDASNFGLVFAFPARPEVKEAQREMFDELEEYTRPIVLTGGRDFSRGGLLELGTSYGAPATARPSVTVVERKRVGDFQATVLTATNADALLQWFKKHQYQFTQQDRENFDYYISKGGYYFVALKISTARSWFKKTVPDYELRPVEFIFQTQEPIFPLRLARDDDLQNKFRIYAIAEKPLIVPGAGVPFSEIIDSEYEQKQLSSLESYLASPVWLTKLDMVIDPSKIERDLVLRQWENPEEYHSVEYSPPLLPQPEQRDGGAGIVEQSAYQLIFSAKKVTLKEIPVEELPWYEQLGVYAQNQTIQRILINIANIILSLIGIIFFIRFVLAGIRLVASAWAHDAARMTKSKKALLRSLLALLIVILLYTLLYLFLEPACCAILGY